MGKAVKNIIPAGHIHIKENVLNKGNISGVSESKALWAKGLDLSREAEYTFFAACGYQHMKYVEGMIRALKSAGKMGMGMGKVMGITKMFGKVGVDLANITAKATASKEDPYTPVLVSSINVLRKLGVDIGYLGDEEPCCGSPVYYAGFEEEYGEHARKNYEVFKSRGVRKVVGLVPACTSALRNTYPKYVDGYDLEVRHVLEVVAARLKETGIRPKVKDGIKVTYHDPCQLSRYLEITEEPRAIIRSIEGVEFVDAGPERSGRWSTCCGGGNLETTHPELSERVGIRRMEELLETGADLILTNCPACDFQLRRIAKKADGTVKVMDLITFLDEALNRE
jgi:Fe-S oxidoreductase